MLEDRTLEDILFFFDHIYLRRKEHIQGLVLEQNATHNLDELDYLKIEATDDRPLSHRILSLPGYCTAEPEQYRCALYAYMIRDLGPQLDMIEFDWQPWDWLAEEIDISKAVLSCVNVTNLTINGEGDDEDCTGGQLATILRAMPMLERFSSLVQVDNRGLDEFYHALTNLEHLTILSLGNADYINDTHVAMWQWKAPLQVLALQGCDELSFRPFRTFIHQFSKTLTVLDIDDVPHADVEADNKRYSGMPFDLPQLDTVSLSTEHDSTFLDSFVNAQLVEFEFGYCSRITYTALEAFILSHSSTLKTVTLQSDAQLTTAQVESLEVLCHAKGIDMTVHPYDDSDDSEEDDTDQGFTDEDGESIDDDALDRAAMQLTGAPLMNLTDREAVEMLRRRLTLGADAVQTTGEDDEVEDDGSDSPAGEAYDAPDSDFSDHRNVDRTDSDAADTDSLTTSDDEDDGILPGVVRSSGGPKHVDTPMPTAAGEEEERPREPSGWDDMIEEPEPVARDRSEAKGRFFQLSDGEDDGYQEGDEYQDDDGGDHSSDYNVDSSVEGESAVGRARTPEVHDGSGW